MKKNLTEYKKSGLWYQIWPCILAIPFVIFLYVLAGICWLVEHLYNFCRGKGWTGLPLL